MKKKDSVTEGMDRLGDRKKMRSMRVLETDGYFYESS